MRGVVVVMGVSGAGKSTVGRALAERLRWPYVEADALHPRANLEKMSRGEPLDNADRAPWLRAVAAEIGALGDAGVVACSALKAQYREVLRGSRDDVRFVLVDVPVEVLRARMVARKGHFMPAALLESQLATLERTADLVVVDVARGAVGVGGVGGVEGVEGVGEVVDEIVRRLGLDGAEAGS